MKMKFLALILVLCMVFVAMCACGEKEVTPSDVTPTVTENDAEPTDKGIFVTEDIDSVITLPEELQGLTLPDLELDDDDEGIFSSQPITEPDETEAVETATEAVETDPPTPTVWDPDVLPEHILED